MYIKMNHALSLFLIIVCALTFTIDGVQAKKGCSAFGHACYGGHGKRSLREQEQEQKQQEQLEQIQLQPNENYEVFPNVAESNKRYENSRMMKILTQMMSNPPKRTARKPNEFDYAMTSNELLSMDDALN